MPAIRTLSDLLARTVPRGDCLEWQGPYVAEGSVPSVRFAGRQQGAQRVAFNLSGHVLPAGQLVYRTCGNPKCIAPGHLAAGTMRQVRAVAKVHGRYNRNGATETHCKNGHPWLDTDWMPGFEGQRRQCQRCQRASTEARRRTPEYKVQRQAYERSEVRLAARRQLERSPRRRAYYKARREAKRAQAQAGAAAG